MSRASIAAAVAAWLMAGSAMAQVAKPPNIMDHKAVDAWIAAAKIDLGGMTRLDKEWIIIGVGREGVYLIRRSLDGSRTRGLKMTTVVNRLELFEPIVDGARTINSIQFDHEVDCLHRTSRRTVLTSYSKHNLVGQPVTEKIEEPWAPFDQLMKPYADDVCQAIEF